MDEAEHRRRQTELEMRYPYDPVLRTLWAEREFASHEAEHPVGTLDRARYLLWLIGQGFPSPRLAEAYFTTLDILLTNRPLLPEPGQLVLGLGTGRTGSTSLAALMATIPGAAATHENPPFLFWVPLEAQLGFHQQRFRRLARHFPLVFDAAHWWLPALEAMRSAFPALRCIALERDIAGCTVSFLSIKGSGIGSLNHWAPQQNGIWDSGLWDPSYPTYPVPDGAEAAPDAAKAVMIRGYVEEYNARLHALAAAEPDRWFIVATEALASATVQQSIFDFLGLQGSFVERRFNQGSTSDSEQMTLRF